jgi:hypothetical protein
MIRLRFIDDLDNFLDTIEDRVIQTAQYGFWCTHVDVEVNGQWLRALPNGGVAIRPANYVMPTQQAIVEIDGADEQAFYAFLDQQLGKPYDWSAVIGIARCKPATGAPARLGFARSCSPPRSSNAAISSG